MSQANYSTHRVTRSSARQAAHRAGQGSSAASVPTSAVDPPASAASTSVAAGPSASRKRKISSSTPSPATHSSESVIPHRRPKRQKVPENKPIPAPPAFTRAVARRKSDQGDLTMSSPESAAGSANPTRTSTSASSSRKPSRNKSSGGGQDPANPAINANRRSKRPLGTAPTADVDVVMGGTEEPDKKEEKRQPSATSPPPPPRQNDEDDSDEDGDEQDSEAHRYDGDDDDGDPFGGFGGPGGPGHGLSGALGALTGMITGISSRLRDILSNLRQKEDPSLQLVALQELSEILLVSNEDNLSGHFSPDSFVKELVALMQPNPLTGEENPEIMLLACRCLANLMEALPASTANVVYGGAVPVLCTKLLEISFIDLAEQALSTLEKISVEYPTSIVREGGLTACLSYLDFFATSTQRTAVTTAANCCRNIPDDSFPVIRDVMPTLLNVLGSSDQRVVEQASLCVSRIVESFKYMPSKLEELVSVDLLKAVLRLLLPGSTNLISPNIHTQFLRVLAFSARASPRLSAELFKMKIVETLYQILTGVSPPSGTDDVSSKLDSVLIMQALIHRPRDQVLETLNVICELLPSVPRMPERSPVNRDGAGGVDTITPSSTGNRKQTPNEKRIELLDACKDEVRRFALILFPTLTDAFSSTVNLSVRQKVLTAQLKMLSNLDVSILTEALKSVSYASFLASILSQQDHSSLVMSALEATELLASRLDNVYRYQLYREGVIAEITKISQEEVKPEQKVIPHHPAHVVGPEIIEHREALAELDRASLHDSDDEGESHGGEEHDDDDVSHRSSDDDDEGDGGDDDEEENDEEGEEDDDEEDDENEHRDDISGSPSSEGSTMSVDGPPRPMPHELPSTHQRIVEAAKKFLETHESDKQGKALKKKAMKTLTNLSSLAEEIEGFYLHRTTGPFTEGRGLQLFRQLASYFDSDVLESVTSAELLESGVVRVLEQVFSNSDTELAAAAQSAFLQVFMGHSVKSRPKTATAESPATPFSVMIHKLQDLLSRSEHFEVMTVHSNTFDGNRSSAASMLAKQIRLKLVADDDSEIPRPYRNIMVSIHAITTFKSLDDYLRPRISLSERPSRRNRDGISRALAAMATSAGIPLSAAARLSERPPPPPVVGSSPLPVPSFAQPSSSRASRKAKSKSAPQSATPMTPEPSAAREKAVLRRSHRRQAATETSTALPPPPPPAVVPAEEDDLEKALECADEKQISDDEDDEDDLADASALDIVGDLHDEMEEEPTPDPSAVNMEVAAGGKITARKDDGTRVATPSQHASTVSSLFSRASALNAVLQSTPSPSSSRPLSYAQAIQAVPQDWHIEFSLDGKTISNDTTIYRAVHGAAVNGDEQMSRSLWSAVHTIKFKRVSGPPPPESIAFAPSSEGTTETADGGVPGSLAKHPTTASILRLLKTLHDLNANVDDVLVENKDVLMLNVEPLSQFVNTKLTAKLNRQLEEPLIVASNCLPSWSEDLARLYPFLFPFETRHLFLQSTSFGYARSMSRWQNTQSQEETRRDRRDDRQFLGRLQRQKVRISRNKILESALKVMELYGASQSILEVEYFEEVGTGLGPTLEFYSTVSREFSKKKLKLWRDNDPANENDDYVLAPNGLFPRPLSEDDAASPNGERIVTLFRALGKFVARSMLDSRIIDINFNPIFFRIGTEVTGVRPSLGAVKAVDPAVARSLVIIKKFAMAKKAIDEDPHRSAAQKVADTENIVIDDCKIDDLSLDFTLPGSNIELIPNGAHISVSIDNVDLYLEKIIDITLGSGVRHQVNAFRGGFSSVFPYSALSAFTPDELATLFGRVEEDWSLETLMDSIKADHGYNLDSKSVKNLLQTMSELTAVQRRDFLQFTTGSPKLPIGGFKSLTPMFTVVCKPSEAPYTSDDYLPSVMTCVNYLKLPDYTDLAALKKQLFVAIKDGQGAFHLS